MVKLTLDKDITFFNAPGSSKKRVFENVANFIASKVPGVDGEALFESLTARERLGSTAIGKGMAIPHCRNGQIDKSLIALVKLEQAIEFDAPDEQPVDVLFVLLVPENCHKEHLQILSDIAKLIDNAEFRNQVRKSESRDELYLAASNFKAA